MYGWFYHTSRKLTRDKLENAENFRLSYFKKIHDNYQLLISLEKTNALVVGRNGIDRRRLIFKIENNGINRIWAIFKIENNGNKFFNNIKCLGSTLNQKFDFIYSYWECEWKDYYFYLKIQIIHSLWKGNK